MGKKASTKQSCSLLEIMNSSNICAFFLFHLHPLLLSASLSNGTIATFSIGLYSVFCFPHISILSILVSFYFVCFPGTRARSTEESCFLFQFYQSGCLAVGGGPEDEFISACSWCSWAYFYLPMEAACEQSKEAVEHVQCCWSVKNWVSKLTTSSEVFQRPIILVLCQENEQSSLYSPSTSPKEKKS